MPAPDDAGLYFYGRAVDSIYTKDNVYWLEKGTGRVMRVRKDRPAKPVEGATFVQTTTFEKDVYPLTSVIHDPDADFWFWDYVLVNAGQGGPKDAISVTFDTPGSSASGGTASMAIHLQAETTDPKIPMEHEVEAVVNGKTVGRGAWDGQTAYTLHLSFDQSLLKDGANELKLKAPARSGISTEIFYLDSFDVSYHRSYRAMANTLLAPADGKQSLTIDGFTRDDITILDVTDPDAPVVVQPAGTALKKGEISFTTNRGRLFLAEPLDMAKTATLEPDRPSSLRTSSNRANYLIIAGPGLEDAAQELAQYRRSTGFVPMVVRIQDVYDEFSDGIVDPFAVRSLLTYATGHWRLPPAYVVLLGDSSFDFKNVLGYGGNAILSPMVDTPEGLFPSDNRLADLDGDDGVPDVAIGRIPARTAADVQAYVAKLRKFEAGSGAWKSRTVWVADHTDSGGDFIDESEDLIKLVPASLQTQRVYVDVLGEDAARSALLDAVNHGALFVHFLGHANMQQIGNGPGLLRAGDVATLHTSGGEPVLAAMSCALGRFDRVTFDTLGESLLLRSGGGVTALWAPTGLSFIEDGVDLSRVFNSSFLRGTRLGDAVRTSLERYIKTAGEPRREVPFLYTVLGDPALRVPR